MKTIALSHVVAGVLLLVPSTRFLGALRQLPMSIGLVAFHLTMMRSGLTTAVPMLALNLVALAEPERLPALTTWWAEFRVSLSYGSTGRLRRGESGASADGARPAPCRGVA